MPHLQTDMYVPILKGKRGEYQALEQLPPDDRQFVVPLIEVPPIAWDFINERPDRPLDTHLAAVPTQLIRSWQGGHLFLDLDLLPEGETMEDGSHPLTFIRGACGPDVAVVPVVGLSRPPAYLEAVARASQDDELGICIRLQGDDFELEDEALTDSIRRLSEALGVPLDDVDLLIDLGELGSTAVGAVARMVRGLIAGMADVQVYRSLILASSAFPASLSIFPQDRISRAPRTDWLLWRAIVDASHSLPRNPTYSDYAIANPGLTEVDPRLMRMSANLRYTTGEEWLIVRGRNVRDYGYEQFNDLCLTVLGLPEFSGPDFSWGDAYIASCAANDDGPGNATTWRRVGTSHHLAFASRQVSNRL